MEVQCNYENRFINNYPRTGRLRGRSSSPGRVRKFQVSILSNPALEPTQPPIQWVAGLLPGGGGGVGGQCGKRTPPRPLGTRSR
jgi:hypothetical protein